MPLTHRGRWQVSTVEEALPEKRSIEHSKEERLESTNVSGSLPRCSMSSLLPSSSSWKSPPMHTAPWQRVPQVPRTMHYYALQRHVRELGRQSVVDQFSPQHILRSSEVWKHWCPREDIFCVLNTRNYQSICIFIFLHVSAQLLGINYVVLSFAI